MSRARRCLFERPSVAEREMARLNIQWRLDLVLAAKSSEYNFDFSACKPLVGDEYEWGPMTPEPVRRGRRTSLSGGEEPPCPRRNGHNSLGTDQSDQNGSVKIITPLRHSRYRSFDQLPMSSSSSSYSSSSSSSSSSSRLTYANAAAVVVGSDRALLEEAGVVGAVDEREGAWNHQQQVHAPLQDNQMRSSEVTANGKKPKRKLPLITDYYPIKKQHRNHELIENNLNNNLNNNNLNNNNFNNNHNNNSLEGSENKVHHIRE